MRSNVDLEDFNLDGISEVSFRRSDDSLKIVTENKGVVIYATINGIFLYRPESKYAKGTLIPWHLVIRVEYR